MPIVITTPTGNIGRHVVNQLLEAGESLRRVITRLLEDALAEALLAGTIKEGDTAIVDLDDDNNVVVHPARTSRTFVRGDRHLNTVSALLSCPVPQWCRALSYQERIPKKHEYFLKNTP